MPHFGTSDFDSNTQFSFNSGFDSNTQFSFNSGFDSNPGSDSNPGFDTMDRGFDTEPPNICATALDSPRLNKEIKSSPDHIDSSEVSRIYEEPRDETSSTGGDLAHLYASGGCCLSEHGYRSACSCIVCSPDQVDLNNIDCQSHPPTSRETDGRFRAAGSVFASGTMGEEIVEPLQLANDVLDAAMHDNFLTSPSDLCTQQRHITKNGEPPADADLDNIDEQALWDEFMIEDSGEDEIAVRGGDEQRAHEN